MKFLFGLLAFIAAVVVVILLSVNLFKNFNSGEANSLTTTTYALDDKAAVDTVARYTVRGPIVADENYRQVRITISKSTRSVEVLKGYGGTVEKVVTLPNTPNAYSAFLGALDAAEFANRRDSGSTDPSATCVTGNKFFYELALESDKKVDTWTSSCSFKDGNFGGNPLGTAQIFKSQIPTYDKITNGVNLSSL